MLSRIGNSRPPAPVFESDCEHDRGLLEGSAYNLRSKDLSRICNPINDF
jgi:hypothetical protein